MSDETVASLGFEINSQPAKDAADVLNTQLVPAAKNAGKAVDDFNKSTDQTAPVVGKLDAVAKQLGVTVDQLKTGIAGSKDGVVSLKTGLDGLGTSTQKTGNLFADMSKNIAAANQQVVKTGSETQAIGSAIAASIGRGTTSFDEMRKGIGAVNGAIGALPPPLNTYTAAVDHASAAHGGLTGQQQALIHSLRSLGEQFASGQISLMSFTQQLGHLTYAMSGEGGLSGAFSGLARMVGSGGLLVGGVLVAAAAFLAIENAVKSASQAVFAAKDRFDALAGVTMGDQYSKGLEQLTKSLGLTRAEIAPTLEELIKLDQPIFGRAKISAGEASAAFRTVFQELRLGGISASDAAAETGKFFDDLIKKEGLTGDALRQLQKISPQAANAVAFGLGNNAGVTKDFIDQLNRVPAPINTVIDAFTRLAASSDTTFKKLQDNPQTLSDAWSKYANSFGKAIDKLTGVDSAKQGADNASMLTKIISNSAKEIDQIVSGFPDFRATLQKNVEAPWSDMVKIVDDETSIFGKSIDINFDGAIQKGLASIGELPTKGIKYITDFVNGAIDGLNKWADGFSKSISDGFSSALESIKAWATDALGPLVDWARQAIAIAQQVAAALGAASNQTVSAPEGVGTTGAIDPLPAFASGTDDAPGGPARINEQGGEIVNLPSGSQVIPHDISMQMAAAGGSSAGASSEVSSAGADKIVTAIYALSGGYHGGATLGDEAHQTSDLISAHVASALKDQTQSLKDAMGAQTSKITNAITSIVNAINSCCGQLVTAIGAVDSDVKSIHLSAANSNFASSGSSSFTSGSSGSSSSGTQLPLSVIEGNLFNQHNNLIGTNGLSGGAIAGGNSHPAGDFDITPLSNQRTTSNQGTTSSNNAAGGFGDSLVYGQGNTIGSGNSSGGRGGPGYDYDTRLGDPNYSPNYSGVPDRLTGTANIFGGDSSYGSFATGGSFIVGGDGGTDTTPVHFMATRGETVEIKQAGASATPSGVSVQPPGSGAAPSAAPAQSAAPVTHKYVTINVQQGMQADTFIKSRAQIAQAA